MTTTGAKYLCYSPQKQDKGIKHNGKYIYFGLGQGASNNSWHTVTRDLENDLKKFEPSNHIISVNSMTIRGSLLKVSY